MTLYLVKDPILGYAKWEQDVMGGEFFPEDSLVLGWTHSEDCASSFGEEEAKKIAEDYGAEIVCLEVSTLH